MGYIGQAPEVFTYDNGDRRATCSMATTESWKDKNTGEKKEATEWHNLVFPEKFCDVIEKYVTKGTGLDIEGKLKTRNWEKDGVKQYRTEIHVRSFIFLPKATSESKSQSIQSSQETTKDLPF